MEEEIKSTERKGIPALHFSVQLQNVFATEIVAKHFPVDASTYDPSDIETVVSIEGINVDNATSLAQAIISVKILQKNEPRLFEIAFKQVGLFTYSKDYSSERVHTFLEQGSLSILLPFAREMLAGLCIRLQVPTLFLSMIPIITPSVNDTTENDDH